MKGLDNREIRELFGEPELGSWGDRCSRLKSAGHILRKNLEKITKIIYVSLPDRIRPLGNPRARWKDQVHKDMQKI